MLDPAAVDALFALVEPTPGLRLKIDLEAQTVATPAGTIYAFAIDPFRKHCLLNGLDHITLTLEHGDRIRAYEATRAVQEPWLFADRT